MVVRINPSWEAGKLKLEEDPSWEDVYTTQPMDLRVGYTAPPRRGAVRSAAGFLALFDDLPAPSSREVWVIYLDNRNRPLAAFFTGAILDMHGTILRVLVLLGSAAMAVVMRVPPGETVAGRDSFLDGVSGLWTHVRTLGSKLLDGIVVGEPGVYLSMAEKGYLPH